jgi:hypothetical protein
MFWLDDVSRQWTERASRYQQQTTAIIQIYSYLEHFLLPLLAQTMKNAWLLPVPDAEHHVLAGDVSYSFPSWHRPLLRTQQGCYGQAIYKLSMNYNARYRERKEKKGGAGQRKREIAHSCDRTVARRLCTVTPSHHFSSTTILSRHDFWVEF